MLRAIRCVDLLDVIQLTNANHVFMVRAESASTAETETESLRSDGLLVELRNREPGYVFFH